MRIQLRRVGAMLLVGIMASVVANSVPGADEKSRPGITGTYSDMHHVPDAGDVIGTEMKIVFAGRGFQGAFQVAEGAPGGLILVDVERKSDSISFSIPDGNPYAGTFRGSISGGALRGEIQFKTDAKETVVLRRGKSYWD